MNVIAPAHLGSRYRKNAPLPALNPAQEEARRRSLSANRDDDWEAADCLCGAQGGRVLSDVDRYGLPCRNVLCPLCGLIRVTPRWTAARYARFYGSDYRDLYSPMSREADDADILRQLAEGPSAVKIAAFVVDAWRRFGDPRVVQPTVIEIGTGGGWNLAQVPPSWRRIGYDSDERFLAAGRAAFGLELRSGFLSEALGALGDADCILLSHIIEHVADPVATLAAVAASARPDALILVEVPGIFRLHKTSLDPMRYWQNAHTYTFCSRTLIDSCRRAGYEPLQMDEWVRAVLKPSSRSSGPAAADAQVSRSIERYLRYCELGHRLRQWGKKLPIAGGVAAWLIRRAVDAVMRAAIGLGFVHGVRVGILPDTPR